MLLNDFRARPQMLTIYILRFCIKIESDIMKSSCKAKACLISFVNYMVVLWGTASKENLKIVEKCIRSSARFLLSKNRCDRVLRNIYENLGWLMPTDSHKYFSLCILYKILRLKCIPFFDGSLCSNLGLDSHDTRAFNNLYIPNIRRNNYGVRSFFYSSSLLWNNLPDNLRVSQSFPMFKKSLKGFLLTDALQKC
jgi:hypothetical protein